MRIDVITAFPAMVADALSYSIPGRAVKNGVLTISAVDLRNFAFDKHRTVDDAPYGGGGGMVLKAEPVFRCVEDLLGLPEIDSADHLKNHLPEGTEVILLSPQGSVFGQSTAVAWSLKKRLIFLCGHYKGFDERIHEKLVTQTVSIGDFVCSGGEYPVLLMIDAIARLLPGALGDAQSALSDSFQDDLLDGPNYTRPEDFRGMKVPDVLLKGNHKEIDDWRYQKKLESTESRRPDLLKKHFEEDKKR